jgi:dihydroorotase-like cyclic amidohydrolase
VYSPSGRFRADLAIKDGKFVGLGLPRTCPRPNGCWTLGGYACCRVFGTRTVTFREPGHTNKEDFESGTRAAAAGGITFCVDQTNTSPHPTTLENFEAKRALVEGKAHIDFGLNGGGLYPEEIGSLAQAGAISIKIFNTRHPKGSLPLYLGSRRRGSRAYVRDLRGYRRRRPDGVGAP